MRRTIPLLPLTLALAILAGLVLARPVHAQRTYGSLTVDGVERTYLLYVPPDYEPGTPWPVVIALHGRGDTGSGFAYRLDLNRVAREHGFIAAYPDGLNHEWNYAAGTRGWIGPDTDDVGFLAALVDALAAEWSVDRARVYVAGFSNGGFMAQRLACEAPDQYAAFAVVSAGYFPGFEQWCATSLPAPILFIHGTADWVVPWTGTAQGQFVMSMPAEETVAYWAEHNGCSPEAVTHEAIPPSEPDAATNVHHFQIGGCAGGSEVVFYAIEGGGHNLPGVPGRIAPEIAGPVNMDIHAGEVVWDFFARHTLTAE